VDRHIPPHYLKLFLSKLAGMYLSSELRSMLNTHW